MDNIVNYLVDKPVSWALEIIAAGADKGAEHPRITTGAIATAVVAYIA